MTSKVNGITVLKTLVEAAASAAGSTVIRLLTKAIAGMGLLEPA
ncbi:hypothetical protein LBMAG53_19040 [Planctomycetota bacterium]|nr:hypothetical protein LBMAG53_19040 [Planctomycetota bacterium]